MLIIKAKGGLGNRMLSAATAITYAQSTGREWCIDWSDGIYAPLGDNAIVQLFPDLALHAFTESDFEEADIKPILWEGRIGWSVREIISKEYPSSHSNPLIYRKLSAQLSDKRIGNSAEVFWSYTSKYGRIKRFLSPQNQRLGKDRVLSSTLKKYFSPKATVLDSVNQSLSSDDNNVLGVHIRYTDLRVPLERVIEQVKDQQRRFDYRSIYLATDSRRAENAFKQKFDNVITQAKRYSSKNLQLHGVSSNSQSTEDAFSALVDMFALSRCAGLVYCSRSTFSETSRLLGDFDCSRVVDVDKYNPLIQLKRALQDVL